MMMQLDLVLLQIHLEQPDNLADIGEHYFSYSFLPQSNIGSIVREAYQLNNSPLIFMRKGKKVIINHSSSMVFGYSDNAISEAEDNNIHIKEQLFSLSNNEIILDTLKLLQKNEKGIILRLFNPLNNVNETDIKVNYDLVSVCYVNLNEDEEREINNKNNIIDVKFKKFQVISLKLRLRKRW